MDLQHWHYPRDGLAQHYVKSLFSSVMLSTTVHAAVGTGLSSFLLKDVVPAALARGFRVAYVDLSAPSSPVSQGFQSAVSHLVTEASGLHPAWRFIKSLFVSQPVWHTAVPPSGTPSLPPADALERFEAALSLLMEQHPTQRVLIVVDHAHQLARDTESRRMAEVLSQCIAQYRGRLWLLYGTEDILQWNAAFRDARAPLYAAGACVHELPALDQGFVEQLCGRAGGQALDTAQVYAQFQRYGSRPGLLKAVLQAWRAQPQCPLESLFAGCSSGVQTLPLGTSAAPAP